MSRDGTAARPVHPVRQRRPQRPVSWAGALAILSAAGLLLTFVLIVQGGVVDGALRRKSVAQHAEATWRCQALRGGNVRQRCLASLNALVHDATQRP